MNVIVDFCLVPVGTGVSLSPYVAACERILAGTSLKSELHANGTNIEGEWDLVFEAINNHAVVHELGAPRIMNTLKVTRGRPGATMGKTQRREGSGGCRQHQRGQGRRRQTACRWGDR
jgi:uncharacterized protein (TIGR00106 family)